VAEAGWFPDPERPDALRYWDGSVWTEHRAPKEPLPVVGAGLAAVVKRPAPRLIRSPWEAEEVAAEWLRWFGFEDAEATGVGSDGGVDVRGTAMVAQVKMHMVPIGRPDLQRLYGVAVAKAAVPVFFSLTDYTRDAKEWADQVRMALFRFSPVGETEPVNGYASALAERAEHQAPREVAPQPPMAGAPIGCSDEAATKALAPPRVGLRQVDRMMWIRQGWLPVASMAYDFTYLATRGRRTEELFAQSHAACELLSGRAIGVPGWQAATVTVPPERINIKARVMAVEVKGYVDRSWDRLCSPGQPAARAETQHRLSEYGVPPQARTLRVTITGEFALPVFTALVAGPGGNRVTVVEGVTGRSHPALSSLFTRRGPHLLDELYAGRPVMG
jgi:hypothetical protein